MDSTWLDVFMNACTLERQSGCVLLVIVSAPCRVAVYTVFLTHRVPCMIRFTERAIATFQAQIEFACFGPTQLTDPDRRSALFEQFWNSDVPRFGEPDAVGWGAWLHRTQRHLAAGYATVPANTFPLQPAQQQQQQKRTSGKSGGQWVSVDDDVDRQPDGAAAAPAADTVQSEMETSEPRLQRFGVFLCRAPLVLATRVGCLRNILTVIAVDVLGGWLDEETRRQADRLLPRRARDVVPDPDCVVLFDGTGCVHVSVR